MAGSRPLSAPLSIYLDFVRFSAAVVVFLSHACNPGIANNVLPNLTHHGADAVTIFFVLSGFVISYTAEQKDHRFTDYLISRLARLWSVAIPALFLSAVLQSLGRSLYSTLYDEQIVQDAFGLFTSTGHFISQHPVARFLCGVFFLNEVWDVRIVEFDNAPYWSLSYEFCYYLLFGVAFYFRSFFRVGLLAAVILVFGPKIMLLFPVWMMGVALHRWRPRVPDWFAWPCIVGPLAAYVVAYHFEAWRLFWRLDHLPFDTSWSGSFIWKYFVGVLFVIHLIGYDSLKYNDYIVEWQKYIRYMASTTLSIYLLHFPILYFLAALGHSKQPTFLRSTALISITAVLIWGLSLITESQKRGWQYILRSALMLVRAGGPLKTPAAEASQPRPRRGRVVRRMIN